MLGNLLRRVHAAASPEAVRGCDSVRPSRDVLCACIDERCVLLDLRAEQFLGLDAIGSRIWTAVERRENSAQLITELAREYDAPVATLEHDAQAFLRDLYRRKLVVLA